MPFYLFELVTTYWTLFLYTHNDGINNDAKKYTFYFSIIILCDIVFSLLFIPFGLSKLVAIVSYILQVSAWYFVSKVYEEMAQTLNQPKLKRVGKLYLYGSFI